MEQSKLIGKLEKIHELLLKAQVNLNRSSSKWDNSVDLANAERMIGEVLEELDQPKTEKREYAEKHLLEHVYECELVE